jgi:outer membrane protein OmpA-like peptidoglycan-associated protein
MIILRRGRRDAIGARLGAMALAGAMTLAGALAGDPAFGAPRAACGERRFNIYFDTGSADLNTESRDALNAAQRSLQGCVVEHVRIVGLTGAKAPPSRAEQLAERRAQGVAEALATGGWPRDRMELVPMAGEGARLGDVSKPLRRRVHVLVQSRPAP